jgi:hypothetical protein
MDASAIDKSSVATGRRRKSVASALANNAFEGQSFGEVEMGIVRRYIDGEIGNDTMRKELLALPLDDREPGIAPQPAPPPPVVRPRKPGEPDPQIEKMLATLNNFFREESG